MADRRYLAWVRKQPCACQPCAARDIEANHSTVAPTFAPGEQRPKQLPGKRGKGQKSADYYAFPLCSHHHGQFHRVKGHFEGWDKKRLERWQHEQSAASRTRYERVMGGRRMDRAEAAPATVPAGNPVVIQMGKYDPRVAAQAFAAEYPTIGAQGEHDALRMVQEAIRATKEGRI